jgi:hypothetical protein
MVIISVLIKSEEAQGWLLKKVVLMIACSNQKQFIQKSLNTLKIGNYIAIAII